MDKQIKTSEQIQAEIERLKSSPYVKLAKKAENDMLNERIASVEKDTKATKEMCRIGFCNMGELVQSGYASEIAKVEADDEEKTEL